MNTKTQRTESPKCVGCGASATATCAQCGKPTCRRSVGFCGHTEGICAECVADRLDALCRAKRGTGFPDGYWGGSNL